MTDFPSFQNSRILLTKPKCSHEEVDYEVAWDDRKGKMACSSCTSLGGGGGGGGGGGHGKSKGGGKGKGGKGGSPY